MIFTGFRKRGRFFYAVTLWRWLAIDVIIIPIMVYGNLIEFSKGGGFMSWRQVVIKSGTGFERVEGAGLISNKGSYVPAWKAVGMPAEAKVYKGTSASGDYVFYFNPAASIIGKEVLALFKAVACDEPDLDGFELLKF
jgi:hypothetical protein